MTHNDKEPLLPGLPDKPRGRPYKTVVEPRSVSMLGIGMVVGVVIGAGIALLMAPQSGMETRRGLSRQAMRLGGRGNAWSRLGRELRKAAAAKRKSIEMEARHKEIAARRAERGEAAASL